MTRLGLDLAGKYIDDNVRLKSPIHLGAADHCRLARRVHQEGRGAWAIRGGSDELSGVLMHGLESQYLAVGRGQEAMVGDIDSDFSLISQRLTNKGAQLLAICYAEWERALP